MSLLIDALRKAEKDRAQSGNAPDDLAGLSLEPMASSSDAPPTLPPDLTPDQRAAANLFEVNHPKTSPQSRLAWFAMAGVLGGLLIGAYVWWQMQPASSLLITRNSPPRDPAPAQTMAPAGTTNSIAAAPEPAPMPAPPSAASTIRRIAPPATPATPRPATTQSERGNLGASVAPPPPSATEPPPVRLARTRIRPESVPPELATAYRAYQDGRLAVAREHYSAHLRTDPNNLDALNGMGAIAMREGRANEALRWFERAQAANPADPVAAAGIASVTPADDPVSLESRLRARSEQAPDEATTQFALGNSLARQGRWSEAQAAYFDAHTADPGNPDFLFNLAVSLDQLAQPNLARTYYQRALNAAHARPAAFDPAAAQARLSELDGSSQ